MRRPSQCWPWPCSRLRAQVGRYIQARRYFAVQVWRCCCSTEDIGDGVRAAAAHALGSSLVLLEAAGCARPHTPSTNTPSSSPTPKRSSSQPSPTHPCRAPLVEELTVQVGGEKNRDECRKQLAPVREEARACASAAAEAAQARAARGARRAARGVAAGARAAGTPSTSEMLFLAALQPASTASREAIS